MLSAAMHVTVSDLTLTERGFLYRATFAAGGKVIGWALVAGRTRAQAMKAARAIAARVSSPAS